MTAALRPAPHATAWLPATLLAALLAGCASTKNADGPEARPPPDVARTPDAVPQVEPIRDGGANKPYALGGRSYTPFTSDKPLSEKGLASWYGRKFHGKRTASGEVYDMYAMTAAHKTMPLPSYARVRNPANGREVIVRVNDRGPFVRDRVIDLSYAAALKLGVLQGVAPVEVERITHEQIRSGSWRRAGAPEPAVPVAPAVEAAARVEAPVPDVMPPLAAESATTASQGFWVQLGAFRERSGAEQFQQRVAEDAAWLAQRLAVFADASLFRLQAGPYSTRGDAQEAAGRIREALKLVPVVVERR